MVALFESARIYLYSQEGDLPEERERIVGIVTGHRVGRWGEPEVEPVDFFDAKGMVEQAMEKIGARIEYRAEDEFGLLRGRTAAIYAGNEPAGVLGQVHPHLAAKFDIAGPAFLFDIDVERLLAALPQEVRHEALSRFPAVTQDIAVTVETAVPSETVRQLIAASSLVAAVRLFDVYEGEHAGARQAFAGLRGVLPGGGPDADGR